MSGVTEPLLGFGEKAPAAVERIGLATPVPEGLVLHPASALVELGVGELDEVEGIGDQGGPGHHDLEHPPVGAREVEGAVLDAFTKRARLFGQPGDGLGTAATRDDVEELAGSDVDDLGGEVLAVRGTGPHHEHLVEPEGAHLADAFLIRVEQGFAIGDDGVVHGVPVAAELLGHLVDAARTTADLDRRPPSRPRGQHLARPGNPIILLGPRAHGAVPVGTHPPALVPHQAGRALEEREVDQLNRGAVLDPGEDPAPRTPHERGRRFDVDPGHAIGTVFGAQEGDTGKSDHPLQRAR